MESNEVIAVVPLKLRSQRVPNKNFRALGDKPLCWWMLDKLVRLREGGCLRGVYAFGESKVRHLLPSGVVFLQEESVPPAQGANQIFRRIIERAPRSDWVLAAFATAPFIRLHTMESALAMVGDEYDSAVSALEMRNWMWQDGKVLNHDAAQKPLASERLPVYVESRGFWLFQRSLILQHDRRVGHSPFFVTLHGAETIDVDTMQDWEWANSIAGVQGTEQ
jgi:CMP-N-acetylneuraminic acid synthetase